MAWSNRVVPALVAAAVLGVGGLAGTAAGPSARAATAPSPMTAAATAVHRVGIHPSSTTPTQGRTVRLTGRVRPAAAGRWVRLQVRYDGGHRWRSMATQRLDRSSHYTFRDSVATGRERRYRVIAPTDRTHRLSRAVSVQPYRWTPFIPAVFDFGALAGWGSVNRNDDQSRDLTGKLLKHSLVAASGAPSGSVTVGLTFACTELSVDVTLARDSQPGGTATVTLQAGDTTRTVAVDPAHRHVVVPLDGERQVTFAFSSTGGALPLIGDMRGRCDFFF